MHICHIRPIFTGNDVYRTCFDRMNYKYCWLCSLGMY